MEADDFEPYKKVKDFFGSIKEGLSNPMKTAPKGPTGPAGGEPGRPERLFKASPAQMKRQEMKRSAKRSSKR